MKTMNYSLLRTIFALIIGLVLVMWPDAASDYIVITTGVLFMVPGLISVIGYFALKPREGVAPRFPVEGVGSVLLGLWLVIMPAFFGDILMFLLGIVLMLGGVQQISSLLIARRWTPVSLAFYIVPVLLLGVGLFSLFNPTGAKHTIFIFLGVSSLIYAVTELFHWFRFTRLRPKKAKSDIEDAKIIE